jgi:hypothetical protein
MWGALSDERTGLQLLLALAGAVILGSESRVTHDHILLYQIRDSPNLEGQVPVFISLRNRWPGYTPRHWVPFSSPPYDSHGYGGCIRIRLHAGAFDSELSITVIKLYVERKVKRML